MTVEIINPNVLENLDVNHGEFARVCYDTPKERAESVGRSCQKTGHMSGSRCEYIKFRISGVDRGTAEQCMRHEIGIWVPFEMQDNYMFAEVAQYDIINENPANIVKNMASFRYIDKGNFKYETPKVIAYCEKALKIYDTAMGDIAKYRAEIKAALLENACSEREAIEAVNMLMPRATTTDLVIGFTPEALIHYCHKRLCSRSQEFIQQIAKLMRDEVKKYNSKFAANLVPQCEYLLFCPEGSRCCGRKPTREKARAILKAVFDTARMKENHEI